MDLARTDTDGSLFSCERNHPSQNRLLHAVDLPSPQPSPGAYVVIILHCTCLREQFSGIRTSQAYWDVLFGGEGRGSYTSWDVWARENR